PDPTAATMVADARRRARLDARRRHARPALIMRGPSSRGGRMSNQEQSGKSGLVFGARNLGGAIIDTLIADGWAMAGVARSTATLEKIANAGALALEADVTDQASVTRALGRATEANGRIDLVVNAAAAYGRTRTGPFGGGPIAEASADAFDSWAIAPARSAFAFLSGAGNFLTAQ